LAWNGTSARSSVTVADPGVKLAWVTRSASTMSVCRLAKSAGGAFTLACMAAQSLRPQASR
jgi:cystathionine beta-lyase/cystathionine gamma-synthase